MTKQMWRSVVPAIVAVWLTLPMGSASGQSPSEAASLSTGLPAGPHRVGFRREWTLDRSRRWSGSRAPDQARPIRLDVWYPADPSGGCQVATVRDFLAPRGPDATFEAANRLIVEWDRDSYGGFAEGVNRPVEALLSLRSSACLDAARAVGAFPVVMYSGGWYNRSPDNVALSEYLASYGYVIVAVPLFGDGLVTGNLRSSPEALETQTRDVAAGLAAVAEHPWVDGTRVASMGFSSGGIVALTLAARDAGIDAVIGLDPSYSGEPDKVLTSRGFSPEAFTTPVLTLRAGHERFAARDRSALLTALTRADRYTADVGRGSHGDFSDDVVMESVLSLVRPGEPRTTAEGIAAYRATATAVRLFLDGVLRERAASLDELAAGTAILRMMVEEGR